jgi:hypothetical protein
MTRFRPGSSSPSRPGTRPFRRPRARPSPPRWRRTPAPPRPLGGGVLAHLVQQRVVSKPSSLTLAMYMVGLAVIRCRSRSSLRSSSSQPCARTGRPCRARHGPSRHAPCASLLVAGFGHLGEPQHALLHGLQVGQRQLGVDHFDVGDGIDAAGHVHHVVVLEAAHHMGDGVGLADMARNLLPSPSPLEAPATSPAMSTNSMAVGITFCGLTMAASLHEPRVRHRHHAHVGIDGAEGIVLRLDARRGQGVEQGGLADIGQTDDTAFEWVQVQERRQRQVEKGTRWGSRTNKQASARR